MRVFGSKPKHADDEKGTDADHVCFPDGKRKEQVLNVGDRCEFCHTVMG